MKKRVYLLLVGIIFISYCLAFAHPPSDIKITYDPEIATLTAVIYHNVSNTKNHYIKKVDIGLNGKEIKEIKFTEQENNSFQTLSLVIPDVRPGDRLSVEGYCSISGKLEKEIKV